MSQPDVQIVILAGGQGTRFWPMSRRSRPKQFLSIAADNESMIQATLRRVQPLCGKLAPLVIAGEEYRNVTQQHVPDAHFLAEPMARNTAAAVGLAAIEVLKRCGDVVMLVLPADHVVREEAALQQTLTRAAEIAVVRDVLVTIGIPPKEPHTGYGYIQRGAELDELEWAFRATHFFEKPDKQRAVQYCQSNMHYWNSGMFIWRPTVLLEAMANHLPDLHRGLMEIEPALGTEAASRVCAEVYPELESISVDFGVMERAQNVIVVAAPELGWSDVGSWDAWAEQQERDTTGNVVSGDALLVDSKDCVVHSQHKLTAVLGLEDVVLIDSEDAILVCPRDRVQEVKKIVEGLRERKREELL